MLAGIGFFAYWQERPRQAPKILGQSAPRTEHEAFMALSFGRISETIPEALPATVFREQIAALKKAGYTPVSLEDVEGFLHGRALPAKPILLVFGEAQRETMEIADATISAEEMRGVLLVNLEGVREANVDLVSRHRLRQLIDGGRWEAGVDANVPAPAADGRPPRPVADLYRRDREVLEQWLGRPVLAIAQQRERFEQPEAEDSWRRTLSATGYRLGFVLAPPRANYIDDSPFQIRSIRVPRDWNGQELISQIAAREPRRQEFVDDFKGTTPSPAWVVDHGEISIQNGSLQLTPREGQSSGLVWLAGTERWRDAAVTVDLAAPPTGQFWLGLRTGSNGGFIRLGVAGGRAVLQRAEPNGETHEVAARDLSRSSVALTLRMIGGRASAEVDGQSMLDRPAEIPRGLEEGSVTLAVWSPKGEPSARVRRVEAEPLSSSLALVSATPDEASWSELRRRVDSLAILSPRLDGYSARGAAADPSSQAMEIFARYHHVSLFPALTVDRLPAASESQRLVEEALRISQRPTVDGVNVVLPRGVATSQEGLELVSALRSRLAESKKPLIVTVLGEPHPIGGRLEDLTDVYVTSADRASRLDIAQAPLRFVRPGA